MSTPTPESPRPEVRVSERSPKQTLNLVKNILETGITARKPVTYTREDDPQAVAISYPQGISSQRAREVSQKAAEDKLTQAISTTLASGGRIEGMSQRGILARFTASFDLTGEFIRSHGLQPAGETLSERVDHEELLVYFRALQRALKENKGSGPGTMKITGQEIEMGKYAPRIGLVRDALREGIVEDTPEGIIRLYEAIYEEDSSPSEAAPAQNQTISSAELTNSERLTAEERINILSESLDWPVDIDTTDPNFVQGLRDLIEEVSELRRRAGSNEYSFMVLKAAGGIMDFDMAEKLRKVKLGAIYIPDLGQVETVTNTSGISARGDEEISTQKESLNLDRQLAECHVHPDNFYNQRIGVAFFSGSPYSSPSEHSDFGTIKGNDRAYFVMDNMRPLESLGDRAIFGQAASEYMDRLANLTERGNMVVNLPTENRPTLLFTIAYNHRNGLQIDEFEYDPRTPDPQRAIRRVRAPQAVALHDSYIGTTAELHFYYDLLPQPAAA